MDLASLPIAALPLPTAAPVPTAPGASGKLLPLSQRLTLNPTITAKVNYFDLAQTRRAPFDLRTALIWLCLCAHDNSVWWEPRSPEHGDGEDAPPLPLALNFAAWMRYLQDWQAATFAVHEDQDIEALALRVWIGAHETVCVPEEDSKKKRESSPPHWSEFYAHVLSGGDSGRRDYVLFRMPLRAAHAQLHAWLAANGVACLSPAESARRDTEIDALLDKALAS